MHTNNGQGNPELANLPRKLNIGLSPSRDDFPHTHINDVGLKAVKDPESGEVRPPAKACSSRELALILSCAPCNMPADSAARAWRLAVFHMHG